MSESRNINMLQEVKKMLNIKFTWQHPPLPEFDPEIHDPDEVFALLCYRGIHYAKWCNIKILFQ